MGSVSTLAARKILAQLLEEDTLHPVEKAAMAHGDVDKATAAVASADATFLLKIMFS